MANTIIKSNLEEERLPLPVLVLLFEWCQELKAGTWKKTMEEHCLLAYLFTGSCLSILIQPKTTCLGIALPMVDWTLLHQLIINTNFKICILKFGWIETSLTSELQLSPICRQKKSHLWGRIQWSSYLSFKMLAEMSDQLILLILQSRLSSSFFLFHFFFIFSFLLKLCQVDD